MNREQWKFYWRAYRCSKKNIEVWVDVVGYEGKYVVSNLGNIRSLNYKRRGISHDLKINKIKNLYSQVVLSNNGISKTIRVHQLVAESFLGHVRCGHKLVVNHIDYNRQNNFLYNIEIVTSRENSNLKHIKSSSKYIGVSWDSHKRKWASAIYINGKTLKLGKFKVEIDAHKAYQQKLKEITND